MTSPPPVLIVGASARAAAQSVSRAGYPVWAADQFADYDTAEVAEIVAEKTFAQENETQNLASLLQREAFQSSPIYTFYVGGWENSWKQVRQLERMSCLLGNASTTLQKIQDRIALHQWIKSEGFAVPATASLNRHPDSIGLRSLLSRPTKKYLKKRLLSCGGLGIEEVNKAELLAALKESSSSPASSSKWIYQERIEGRCQSAIYLAYPQGSRLQCQLLGVTEQLGGDSRFNAPGFLYTGSLLDPNPDRQLTRFAKSIGSKLASEFQLRGLFNIDFIVADDGYYFLEVNPRYSASMELWEQATGINLFQLQVAAFDHQRRGDFNISSQLELARSACGPSGPWHGKAIWYADRPLQGSQRFIDEAMDRNRGHRFPQVADIPRPGVPIHPGSPAFTVFRSGESVGEVAEKLQKTARMIACYLDAD